ncbi:MAG: pilus assembly protein PilY [Gammaproteobacteria bacterium]|nr:pilus assembly protein PilY [Gammaproteobacteria bacterium]NIR98050.1 pilus assembly protein PilY [Gammaproteobacteria bacterium]NIT63760.1 pilus assembly protein PilY [Gammaproteobacteria bacterium]NIV20710.1 pilus assembly protein PilY [Gammaproteobacteria bacterium]NIY32340.1 pilus assembly protein PilY [Gammaproteobacteria bacterium]
MKIAIPKGYTAWLNILAPLLLLWPAAGYPGPGSLADKPLFLSAGADPNVMFTLDDSGSMQWEFMPDEEMRYSWYMFPRPDNLYGGTDYTAQVPTFDDTNIHNFFARSSANNTLFYNPDVDYEPWANSDGTRMPDADPTAAYFNLRIPALGTIDLTSQQTMEACWFSDSTSLSTATGDPCFGDRTFWPITYYLYDGSGSRTDLGSYTKVQITSSTPAGTSFTSPNGTVRTRDEEIQNFANWYQYYRSRIFAARAGIGHAFAQQNTSLRVGFSALNVGNANIDGIQSHGSLVRGLRPFSGSDRDAFFDLLYDHTISATGTPLRNALDDIGQYFQRTDDSGPWAATPGTSNGTAHLTCRQSYNVLMSDGYWNGSAASTADARANVDNSSGPALSDPQGNTYQYTPDNPYSDGYSDTLADVAMYYWYRDLRTDLANEVTTNEADPAFWQHLVNFTVGLGKEGTLDPSTDLPGLEDGSTQWPDPTDLEDRERIDDLWHAALNSRGGFFRADDPDRFAEALSDALNAIASRTGSGSAVAFNTGSLSTNSAVYISLFNSARWSGDLLAYSLDPFSGSISSIPLWSGAQVLDSRNLSSSPRVILTHDGADGTAFQWSNLSTAQQDDLRTNPAGGVDTVTVGQARLDYIRGDRSNEGTGENFRVRNSRLGDIVHSGPVYVGAPEVNWPDTAIFGTAGNRYSDFKTSNYTRPGVIYVGANDGMLHGFDEDTGEEVLAYVPSELFSTDAGGGLHYLTDLNYGHRYSVDLTPTVSDAYVATTDGGTADWATVVVGGLRGGGRGLFALDVTDPAQFSEANAADLVMWEFTNADDPDLGYTYSQPSVTLLNNGRWAAIFANGYNDTGTGEATLFIAYLDGGLDGTWVEGTDYLKISTGVGTTADRNGLATPAVVDMDGNGTADRAYAGDLEGNLWAFDLSNSSASNWDVAYTQGSNPLPLFTAQYSAAGDQPIITAPEVVKNPLVDDQTGNQPNVLVLFGTGQYLTLGDRTTTGTQSFYGVWDQGTDSLTRTELHQQTFLAGTPADTRVLSDDAVGYTLTGQDQEFGWYIDLPASGERQVTDSIVRGEIVYFNTTIPSTDPCAYGGESWLMSVEYANGGRPEDATVDYTNDGVIDADDLVDTSTSTDVAASGHKFRRGVATSPRFLGNKRYTAGTGGGGGGCQGADCVEQDAVEQLKDDRTGRLSWEELNW